MTEKYHTVELSLSDWLQVLDGLFMKADEYDNEEPEKAEEIRDLMTFIQQGVGIE